MNLYSLPKSVLQTYEERFGSFPRGFFKLVVDTGAYKELEEAMKRALASGTPIADLNQFRPRSFI